MVSLQQALGQISSTVLAATPEADGPPTLNELCQRIVTEPYTLLHILAHGKFAASADETYLYLANDQNGTEPVKASELIERLEQLQGARGLPHLTFLATCESAVPEAEGSMGGLAQRLVRELGMPAVVAMTDKISIASSEILAKNFYIQLRQHGEVDRALVEATVALADRPDFTVPALYSRLGGRPLFSDSLDRDLANPEIAYGLSRLETLLEERAPIQLPLLVEKANRLRGYLNVEETALAESARRERESDLTEINQICEEVLELSFNALAMDQDPPPYDARCPFRGLYPFRGEDRTFFFGRTALVERLVAKIAKHNFLAVLGPSGSGKSSLVLAGLMPALQSRRPGLQLAYMTPGADPIPQLAAALAKIDFSLQPHDVVARDTGQILVVDQFEEIFTLTPEEQRRIFLDRLLELNDRLWVVLTMRADFWGECAPHRRLSELMQVHQELIGPMNAEELRGAIEQQARSVALRFEADLSNTILDDVKGEPGAMPLLQHALLELWKRRHGRWLRAAEYRAIGGVQRAIARTAEDIFSRVDEADQFLVQNVFVRLTRLDEDPNQEGEFRDTRRRVHFDSLVPAESDPELVKRLVQRLADARLVVTSVNAATGRDEVEVAHEALIHHWPRLRNWLDQDREHLRLRQKISQDAQEWALAERNNDLLPRWNARLQEAVELSNHPHFTLNDLERAYLDACVALRDQEEAERERQRQQELEAARQLAEAQKRRADTARRALIGVGILLLLAIVAAGFAITQRQDAINKGGTAEAERENAISAATSEAQALAVAATQGAAAISAEATAEISRSEAERGQSRQLALKARDRLDSNDSQQALLIAIAGLDQVTDTAEIYSTFWNALDAWRGEAVLAGSAGHHERVFRVAFSPDSQYLASVSNDDTVRLWQLENDPARSGPRRPYG